MNLDDNRVAGFGAVELSWLQSWSVVGKGACARLFGILRKQAGEAQYRWILSPPLERIDFEDCRAETVDGTRWTLLLPLSRWSDEARSALRAVASVAGLDVRDLDAKACIRPGERLGGVSDQAWIRAHEIARALEIQPPRREFLSVRSFNALHGPVFMANRQELVRKISDPTKVDRSNLPILEFDEAYARARISADLIAKLRRAAGRPNDYSCHPDDAHYARLECPRTTQATVVLDA